MKLTIETKKLSAALSKVQSVIESRNTIPVLSNVLLQAQGDTLRIEGTDLEVTMSVTAPASISEEGGETVSAKLLADIVRKLPGTECTLETSDGHMLVKSGRSRFKLATLPVEDWPSISYMPPRYGYTIPAVELKDALESVAIAMSSEESRYYLNGVFMHSHNGRLRFVATDGHRLALRDSIPCTSEGGIIIPRKAIHEAVKLCGGADDVAVSYSESAISFEVEGARLQSKLIDATYPDYQRIIPQSNDQRATVDVQGLASSVDRVSSVAEDGTKAVRLSWAEYGVSTSVNSQLNNATDELDADCNFELVIGVNSKYLRDALGKMEGKVEFAFNDSSAPMLLREVGNEDYLVLIMPMRA